MRRAFVALVWRTESLDACAQAALRSAEADADPRHMARIEAAGLRLWTTSAAPLPVLTLPPEAGWLVGNAFEMPGAGRSPLREGVAGSPRDLAVRISRTLWGSYVALLRDPATGGLALYRDPSGLLDCLTWRLGAGVWVVASDLTRVPGALRPRWPALNWRRIADYLAAPGAATSAALLDDIEAVGPGDLLTLDAPARPVAAWTPAAFAADPVTDFDSAQREIVARVDRCTAALVGGHERVLVELSGGLDSSVLAGSLGASGQLSRVVEWLNVGDLRPEGDEGRYAQAVTDRLGVGLTVMDHRPGVLTEEDFADLAMELWPAMEGADAARDRAELARLHATGATAILSGEGGDGAFFQMPSALVAADELQRRGLGALGSPVIADVARRTRQSVWAVLGEVWAARRGRSRRPPETLSLLGPDLDAASRRLTHRWVADAADRGLPLGKRKHISAIANQHLNHGPSRRRRQADLLFPLMAQPVLELCLAIPTPDLAGASYDRPFERAAFAHRIPELVLNRRAKGNLAVYFSRLVANSVDMLRPYLLDGCLCEAGLLDRRRLDRMLDPHQLIWDARATDVLWAATVEA
ncbi:MAG: asparagine synthase-related protein, partial [Phenylobacterium sp.]